MFSLLVNKLFITLIVDIFPFKFEIADIIIDFLKSKRYRNEEEINLYRSNALNTIHAFMLMFLAYKDKQRVWNYLKTINKEIYIQEFPKEVYESLARLPPVIYCLEMFGKEEIQLLQFLKIDEEILIPYQKIYDYVIEKITTNEEYKVYRLFKSRNISCLG